MMIIRSVTKAMELALKRQAAVAMIGPRQAGKTTLARKIADSHPGALYLDLEARESWSSRFSSSANMKAVWSCWMKFIVSRSCSTRFEARSTKAGAPVITAGAKISHSTPRELKNRAMNLILRLFVYLIALCRAARRLLARKVDIFLLRNGFCAEGFYCGPC